MACLVDDKAQDRQASEEQKNKEILELQKGMDYIQTKNNQLKDLHQKVEHLYTKKTQEALALSVRGTSFWAR